MSYNRMKPADRKAQILEAAITVAVAKGFNNFRLVDIAEQAKCSTGSVIRYWATMVQVRRDVMRAAIKGAEQDSALLRIVATGVALGDARCRKLSPELRARAVATLG